MPRVKYAPGAIRDLHRLNEFLRPLNPNAAKRASQTILQSLQVLEQFPQSGRRVEDLPDEYREWPIAFGNSGYVARYRVDADGVIILAIRHAKEAGYSR